MVDKLCHETTFVLRPFVGTIWDGLMSQFKNITMLELKINTDGRLNIARDSTWVGK